MGGAPLVVPAFGTRVDRFHDVQLYRLQNDFGDRVHLHQTLDGVYLGLHVGPDAWRVLLFLLAVPDFDFSLTAALFVAAAPSAGAESTAVFQVVADFLTTGLHLGLAQNQVVGLVLLNDGQTAGLAVVKNSPGRDEDRILHLAGEPDGEGVSGNNPGPSLLEENPCPRGVAGG
ncbi:MAG: hypothetical protein PWQ39_1687 [Thermacetogenium sp.]|nr:hypothetical protein [Thermacetogenium sp.]